MGSISGCYIIGVRFEGGEEQRIHLSLHERRQEGVCDGIRWKEGRGWREADDETDIRHIQGDSIKGRN